MTLEFEAAITSDLSININKIYNTCEYLIFLQVFLGLLLFGFFLKLFLAIGKAGVLRTALARLTVYFLYSRKYTVSLFYSITGMARHGLLYIIYSRAPSVLRTTGGLA